jgi:hypothetical protein
MKYSVLILVFVAYSGMAYGQKVNEAISPDKNYTLNERYRIMRDNSPTYNEYKEVKGYVLEGFWKIIADSLNVQRAALRQAHGTIAGLRKEVQDAQASLKQKDASMAEVLHNSTHITVAGMDMTKSVFITVFTVVVAGLALIIIYGTLRLKWMRSEMREKIDLANRLNVEFEEYKRNALDKQMKISRELQNERNRIQEMKS